MKEKIILFLVLIFLFSCDNVLTNDSLKVKPLHPYFLYRPEGTNELKLMYYFVEGFNYRSSQIDSLIQFSQVNFIDSSRYQMYQVVFYKKSNEINEKFQSQEGDYIDWHHDDLILEVRVNYGEMGTVNRYYKGRLLNKSDAEVISIEPVIGNDTLN
jgi:hypothetical protein